MLLRRALVPAFAKQATVVMGPCLRRDDISYSPVRITLPPRYVSACRLRSAGAFILGQALIPSLWARLRRTALFRRSEQKNSVRLPATVFRLQDRTGCDVAMCGE
jgi:hypothetical protein